MLLWLRTIQVMLARAETRISPGNVMYFLHEGVYPKEWCFVQVSLAWSEYMIKTASLY